VAERIAEAAEDTVIVANGVVASLVDVAVVVPGPVFGQADVGDVAEVGGLWRRAGYEHHGFVGSQLVVAAIGPDVGVGGGVGGSARSVAGRLGFAGGRILAGRGRKYHGKVDSPRVVSVG